MIEIFKYSDYRKFLEDWYESHKSTRPQFSYRYMAEKVGINSSGFFKNIIDGKRNLTPDTVLKVCAGLGLKDEEAQYFEGLVLFNQAKILKDKNKHFENLIKLQNSRNEKRVNESEYAYFDQWYHCVIKELVTLYDFKDNNRLLAKCLKPEITTKQAGDSIKLLLKLGYIKKENGRYVSAEPTLTTGYSVNSHKVVRFQIEMLKKAVQSFESLPEEVRLNSSTTLRISKKNYARYVEKIRELRRLLLKMETEENQAESVYQLNISLAPMATIPKRGGQKNA